MTGNMITADIATHESVEAALDAAFEAVGIDTTARAPGSLAGTRRPAYYKWKPLSDQGMTATQAARALGTSRTAAYRIAKTYSDINWVAERIRRKK